MSKADPVPDYPDYVVGRDKNTVDQAFDKIAQALIDGRSQFLFGAGMSRDSGLPLGHELKVTLLRKFFPSSSGTAPTEEQLDALAVQYPFEAIVQAVEQQPGGKRDELTELLKQNLEGPGARPNKAHTALVSLLGYPPRIKTLFTTNYDTLLEQALGEDFAVAITEKNAAKIEAAKDAGKIPIIYLRGKLDGEYQITEPEVATRRFQLLKQELNTALHSAEAFVFVGYSLDDIDFRQLYLSFLEQLDTRRVSRKTTYFVSPPRSEHSYLLGAEIWRLREAVWIPFDAKSFFLKLKHVVENRAVDDIRSQVRQKYRVSEPELDDLIERTANVWRMEHDEALLFLYQARTRIGGVK